ncbi:hypothetical protein ACQ4PT_030956 [Festuca glaucescens]
MTLLDAGILTARAAVSHVSEFACPPCQTALTLLEERVRLGGGGRLATTLCGLDEALGGGIPLGKLTEVVGPSGIGKTQMAGRILVMRPTSLSDFTKSLEQMKVTLLQNDVKLLIVDSVAALTSSSISEFARIPVVVTNQVRSQSNDDGYHYSFEVKEMGDGNGAERLESHLVAALGIQWAHAVTIRLVFESHSGHRFIKVAKSPMSPAVAFPFIVESSGITLLSDEGIDVSDLSQGKICWVWENDHLNATALATTWTVLHSHQLAGTSFENTCECILVQTVLGLCPSKTEDDFSARLRSWIRQEMFGKKLKNAAESAYAPSTCHDKKRRQDMCIV